MHEDLGKIAFISIISIAHFFFKKVQKVLEFVDEHGNEVLNLGSFTLLPQHVVRLILAREELQADEFTKFQAALMWSKKYCDTNPVNNFFFSKTMNIT
jgi:hypothetical protein